LDKVNPPSVELSLFQKVLLSTDGTVTDLIALYTGESIRVTKVEQVLDVGTAPALLDCEGSVQLLRRKILLSGVRSNYLYADSLFVFDRFSTATRQQLLHTDRPIGLLWNEARLETYREVVAHEVAACPDIAPYFSLADNALFVSRTYVIYRLSKPLGAITEKWPLNLFRD
jgi:chorismate-pyruvate lyase